MIPKTIHYCWFGGSPKGEPIEKCIASWRQHMPEYEIVEWNENNFDINQHPYTRMANQNKKWAFISDYARLAILRDRGGIYLDTDMFVVKSLNEILDREIIIGYEDDKYINASILGSIPNHPYISDVLTEYDTLTECVPIPKILTNVYTSRQYGFTPFSPVYFYPFDSHNIKKFNFKNAPSASYAVHMWNYSWGHPAVKFAKAIGLHKLAVTIADKLKIKTLLKKILRVI